MELANAPHTPVIPAGQAITPHSGAAPMLRLRGGGGDGGSTGAESRSSYLEMYMEKKVDKVRPQANGTRSARRCSC